MDAAETLSAFMVNDLPDSGYLARAFEDYLRMLAIRHIYCAPHHPQTNGKIERSGVHTAKGVHFRVD